MNIEDLEIRVNKMGGKSISYWENGVLVGKKCTVCGEDKKISEFNFHNKKKGTYRPECKECEKERVRKWQKNNANKEKERLRKHYENNIDKARKHGEQWRKNNPNYGKEYFENNKEYFYKKGKEYRVNNKEKKLEEITNLLEQINPSFKQLNLPIYGYVYKFKNVKTGRAYIGQTIRPLKTRYHNSNIIQGWIKERVGYDNQKFKEELTEKDIEVTEVLDVAFCQYHLNKLEAYYINKYDSYNNGYNNHPGKHITDDGIEEFNQILEENGLEFKNGELIQIKNTHQDR